MGDSPDTTEGRCQRQAWCEQKPNHRGLCLTITPRTAGGGVVLIDLSPPPPPGADQ